MASQEIGDKPPKRTGERPGYANGRKAMLEALDALLNDHHNVQKLSCAWQVRFDEDPVTFFTDIVKPLIPRAMMEVGLEENDLTAHKVGEVIKAMMQSVGGLGNEEEESP